MTISPALYQALDIKKGEERAVSWFVVYSFFMGMAMAVFYTASTSLFMVNFKPVMLPWAYVAGGALVYGLGLVVSLLQRYLSFTRLMIWLAGFLLVSVVALLLGHFFTGSRWLYFVIYLWNRIFIFVNGIAFWATASRVFRLQQAKRLFSFISMGDVVSSIISYFSVPLLLKVTTTEGLFYIAALALVGCLAVIIGITRVFAEELTGLPINAVTSPVSPDEEQTNLANPTYRRYLYLLALLPVFGLYYVEFLFTTQSKLLFPDKELLASFLGVFFGLCAIVELLLKALLYSRLINRFGVRLGIVMLPATLVFSFVLAGMYGTIYGATGVFFALIALSRFFTSSVRKAISEPSFQILFQPIPVLERTHLQRWVEGRSKALGIILPGLLLLLLNSLAITAWVELSYVFLVVLAGWLVISLRIQPEYHALLRAMMFAGQSPARESLPTVIQKAATGSAAAPDVDSVPFHDLARMATSPRAFERKRAAYLLGMSGRYFAFRHLIPLLTDEAPDVRKAAIRATGIMRNKPEIWPYVFQNLATVSYRRVASQALVQVGGPVIPTLDRFFNRSVAGSAIQRDILQIVARIGGDAAIRFLRTRINYPVPAIRSYVIELLAQMGYRASMLERPALMTELDETIAILAWNTAARVDLGKEERLFELVRILKRQRRQLLPRAFQLLTVLSGDRRFLQLERVRRQENAATNGYLLELYNVTLPEEWKGKLLPLLEDIPLPEVLRRCATTYPQQRLEVEARLKDIINKEFARISPFLKALAIRILADRPNADSQILAACAASSEPIISETALVALKQQLPERFRELSQTLADSSEALRRRLAQRLMQHVRESDLLLNRALVLSRVPELESLDDTELVELLTTLVVHRLAPGGRVPLADPPDEVVWVVAAGRVRLINGGQTSRIVERYGRWDCRDLGSSVADGAEAVEVSEVYRIYPPQPEPIAPVTNPGSQEIALEIKDGNRKLAEVEHK